MYNGVLEHQHEENPYWHRANRIHQIKKDRLDQEFILTGCGVGCGYWEGERDFGGYRNACDECQSQNGDCHIREEVIEQGGIINGKHISKRN